MARILQRPGAQAGQGAGTAGTCLLRVTGSHRAAAGAGALACTCLASRTPRATSALGTALAFHLGVLARPLAPFSFLIAGVYAAAAVTANFTDGVAALIVASAAATGAASSLGFHRGLLAMLAAALIGSFEPATADVVLPTAALSILGGCMYGFLLVMHRRANARRASAAGRAFEDGAQLFRAAGRAGAGGVVHRACCRARAGLVAAADRGRARRALAATARRARPWRGWRWPWQARCWRWRCSRPWSSLRCVPPAR